MNTPQIDQCPACGITPQPHRDGKSTLGLWCECGFNSSLVDEMHAEYLARFHPKLSIRVAAERIRARVPLLHSMAKVA